MQIDFVLKKKSSNQNMTGFLSKAQMILSLLVESQPDINKRNFDKIGFEFWL